MAETDRKIKEKTASPKDADMIPILQMVNEAYARGIKFLKPSLTKSHASWFLPEDGAIRCPFSSMGGLGESAAQAIYDACQAGEILSVEDLRMKAEIGKGVIEIMRKNGVFDDVSETNQLDMFGTTASSSPVQEAPKPAKKAAAKQAETSEDDDEQISLF